MRHWSRALEAEPSTQKELFPILLEIAENPQLRGLLSPYAQNPPPWWESFFSETARRALDVQTVAALHSLRRKAADAPITPAERTAYIARLQRDGLVTAAYLAWVNGLTADERTQLGVLHNGGFELPPTSTGFDWHIRQPEGVIIQTASTYGVQGSKALQLIFKRWEKPFNHVHQPLFLDPGTYRITGRVRTDSLQSVGGLKWVALCRLPEAGVLAESERFLGSSEWRDFSFEVTIPETCVAQELRLSSAGSRDFERAMKGSVWFDAISARRVAPTTPPNPVAAVTQPAAAGPIPDTPTTDEANGSPAVPAPDPDASPSTGSAGDAQAPSPTENVGAPAPDAGGAPRLESVGPINTE
jgi:hypothetical protein